MWFEIYLDHDVKWRWRLCRYLSTGSLDIIATSHQGYSERNLCEIDIKNVKLTNDLTPVHYV